ncbi:MAG: TIGR03546 family protein [Gemmatimonadales bacterium]|nr:TIGR03546 family protein [Gemmatimonadales bacterium]
MAILKLLQSLFATLNSKGTPFQVGVGMALGALLGLSPIANVHNLVAVLLAMLFNLSFGGFLLGWTLFVPAGFLLDPLFDRVGRALLEAPGLQATWTAWYNVPGLPLTNFNNSVVLGAVACWAAAFVPLAGLLTWAIRQYRERVYQRLEQTPFFRALKASKAYNAYEFFFGG